MALSHTRDHPLPGVKRRWQYEEQSYDPTPCSQALRIVGRLDEAEAAYQTANQLSEAKNIGPAERANFFHRLAVLRIDQRRFDEALELVDDAIEIYRPSKHEHLGRTLIKRGIVFDESGRFSEAIPCFGEALSVINPTRDPLAYHSAIHNFG